MRVLLVALLALNCAAAAAQLRAIPPDAKVGTLRHLEPMLVELDGKPAMLAPGAQIRDSDNRIVLPASLQENETVKYQLDATGHVFRVWLLSAPEKDALPQPPAPFPR